MTDAPLQNDLLIYIRANKRRTTKQCMLDVYHDTSRTAHSIIYNTLKHMMEKGLLRRIPPHSSDNMTKETVWEAVRCPAT